MKPWEKVKIKRDIGEIAEGVAPLIISASRSTDIPSYYSKWLMNRMEKGYCTWTNPFNRENQYISFENTRLFVFWSKNPAPLMKHLTELDRKDINYYFQFTLNDYADEDLEPNIPTLKNRINTFKKLSDMTGKGKVIWRFDPLILVNDMTINDLKRKIENIGNQIYEYTEKLVISFADINIYRKVVNNLNRNNIQYTNFTKEMMIEMIEAINELNKNWNLEIATCCEEIDLDKYGVSHNKCIDDELIYKLFNNDKILMNFLGLDATEQTELFGMGGKKKPSLKDKGQRKVCGCIISKDIGQYNTCSHLCRYCYANTSDDLVRKNHERTNVNSESII